MALNLGTGVATPATKPAAPAATPPAPETKPTESQEDANKIIETPKTDSEQRDELQEQVTAIAGDEVAARWSSHPIQRFTLGNFQFTNGLLVLRTQKEAAEFQKMWDELPISEQTRVKKLDLAAAEKMVRENLARAGGTTQGIDSATGDRAPTAEVGKGDLITG